MLLLMAAGNLDSADLKGVAYQGLIREDVMNKIWDISRIPLPLTDMIGTDECKNSYKEWTTDELATPDTTNAKIDGQDLTGNDTATGARVGNHCQISTKIVQVSTRARESDVIGQSDALAYQVMMRQQELRRDVEAIMLTEQASFADTGAAAGKSAGLGAWLETNTDRGAGGADGGFASGVVAAPTTGTTRALQESTVRDVAEAVYEEGGNPTVAMSIPKMIRQFSNYLFTSSARIATLMSDTGQAADAVTAKGAVNEFVTDHGVTLTLVPNRIFQPTNSGSGTEETELFLIDPMYLAIGYLHGYRVEPQAKTGLSDKRQMAVDWTLIVKAEKAHGVIADLDYTAAVTA